MDTLWVNRSDNTPGKRPDLQVPTHLIEESVLLPDSARTNGTFLIAPTGWGKSLWLASMCHQDLMRGVGTVVLDAVGGTVDNCLNKLLYLPEREQRALAEKVIYCNMAGLRVGDTAYDTLVTAWPMLRRMSKKETLDETSQRVVDLITKTNKALESAGVYGMPRVQAVLTSTLQILAALELPISCAIGLLQNPEAWRERISEAAGKHKEVRRARNRLIKFASLPEKTRESWAEVILNRLQRIEFDVVAEAMFSAPKPLVDWDDVVENGKQVLIDLRYEKSAKARELKLFWVWGSIYEYIKSREANGRERPPLSVVIDELSYFVRGTSINKGVITEEFREFIQVYKRNANIWFTAATQEVGELPPELARACLKTGTHLYGAIDSPETARRLATRRRWDVEPKILGYKTLRSSGYGGYHSGFSYPRDVPIYETAEDIQKAYANELQGLQKGQWLAAVSYDEGQPSTQLELIETDHIDEGMYVQKHLVDKLKRYFMKRDGVLVSEILSPSPDAASHVAQDEAVAQEPQSPSKDREVLQPETPPEKTSKLKRVRVEAV